MSLGLLVGGGLVVAAALSVNPLAAAGGSTLISTTMGKSQGARKPVAY